MQVLNQKNVRETSREREREREVILRKMGHKGNCRYSRYDYNRIVEIVRGIFSLESSRVIRALRFCGQLFFV